MKSGTVKTAGREPKAGAGGHLCAVVPSFNEGGRLETVVRALLDVCTTVIVVDDGSSEVLHLSSSPGLYLLRHVLNRGQGAALATGFAFALKLPWDVLVTFDADGQHRTDDLPALTAPVRRDECDVALGSRFLGGTTGMPRSRMLALHLARSVEWLRTGILLSDAHNGLRAFNRKAVEVMDFRLDRFAHASEVLQVIREQGLRWCEVPVRIDYTEETLRKGQSLSGGVRVLADLLSRSLFAD